MPNAGWVQPRQAVRRRAPGCTSGPRRTRKPRSRCSTALAALHPAAASLTPARSGRHVSTLPSERQQEHQQRLSAGPGRADRCSARPPRAPLSLDAVDRAKIGFRALRRDDFALLARWLAEPSVALWWNNETSPDAIERDFGRSVDKRDATELFIAVLSGRPFGLLQRYPIAAYPDYLEELSRVCLVPHTALSIDYLIGEPELRGQGLGAAMIAAFVAACWAACRDATTILVPVASGNLASWRALERAGFTASPRASCRRTTRAIAAPTTSTQSVDRGQRPTARMTKPPTRPHICTLFLHHSGGGSAARVGCTVQASRGDFAHLLLARCGSARRRLRGRMASLTGPGPGLMTSPVAGAATAIRAGGARPLRAAAGAGHAVRASHSSCGRGGAVPGRPRVGRAGARPAPAGACRKADSDRSPAWCCPRAGRHTSERRRSRPSASRCTAPPPGIRNDARVAEVARRR